MNLTNEIEELRMNNKKDHMPTNLNDEKILNEKQIIEIKN